uniref:NADH-ubiquinone oxidoreductase chain 6 n=1 Tax=Cajanus cajan TaxID=3821 RepID=A0A151UEX6_CAJCA
MPPSWGADRIGVSLGSHRPTVILKLPCLVEKKRTKVRSLAVLFSAANWDRSPASPALVSGLMVARAKNPVHSVLFPIPVFRDTSGLLLLLGLDFSAMIFPVVHIGAIAVSFLFVVMMFHIQIAEIHEEVLRYLPVSGIIGLILWWEMFFILDNETIPLLPTQRNTTSLRYTVYAGKVRSWTNLETLGNLLYTYYFVWFLVPSLILLVAMIGAIVLTMHRTTQVKRQDVFRRNAIDFRRTIMRRTTDPLTID